MSDNRLIIFIKYPEPGFVKTRLAKDIGEEKAAFLYRLFVEAILARTQDDGFERVIFYSPSEKKDEIMDWICPDMLFYPQKGKDLGERLSNAFSLVFNKGAKRVLAIGSDSPTIDNNIILRAFRELRNKQCVIGPSQDGGYYLFGLSSFYKEVFQGIEWSTEKVFEETIDILKRSKFNFSILDKNFDVDKTEDIDFLKKKLQKISKINPKGLGPLIEALSERDGDE